MEHGLVARQISFRKRGGDDDKSEVVDLTDLVPASNLLGLANGSGAINSNSHGEGGGLESALCYRTIRARNEVVRADNSPAQAVDARDAMAKAIYGR